jgi:hypothetical protein
MGQIGCPETSVTNYQSAFRNFQKSRDVTARRKSESTCQMYCKWTIAFKWKFANKKMQNFGVVTEKIRVESVCSSGLCFTQKLGKKL